MAYIEVKDVTRVYPGGNGGIRALDGVDFQVEQGELCIVVGPSGAGKTTVMVTLESGEETIYALDTLSGQTQEQQTHVLLDDGTALAQTVCTPRVCGVAVVCEGGGDVRVAARITELLHSLLDLPANRICVEQRKC